MREFAAREGWVVQAPPPGLLDRYGTCPRFHARTGGVELLVAGRWRTDAAHVASVLLRPVDGARPPRRRVPDEVVQVVALEVPPHLDQCSVVVGPRDPQVVGGSARTGRLLVPVVEAARDEGTLVDGDCVVLGQLSLAVVAPEPTRAAGTSARRRLDLLTRLRHTLFDA